MRADNSPELAGNLLCCINHSKYNIIKGWVMKKKRNLKRNWRQQKLITTSQLSMYDFLFRKGGATRRELQIGLFSILYVFRERCFIFKYPNHGTAPYSDTTGAC